MNSAVSPLRFSAICPAPRSLFRRLLIVLAALLAVTLPARAVPGIAAHFSGSSIQIASGFSGSQGMTSDRYGNLYLADSVSGRVIEVIAVNGVITQSSSTRILATLSGPVGVAVDANGNVYVTDQGTEAVSKIEAVNGSIPNSPTVTTLATGFNFLGGIAVDTNGNLFVAEYITNELKELLAVSGTVPVSPVIRTVASGLSFPFGVAVDSTGSVLVANDGTGTLLKLVAVSGSVPASPTVQTVVGGYPAVQRIATDSLGNIFFAQQSGELSKILAVNGTIPASPTVQTITTGLGRPGGVATDAYNNVYSLIQGSGVILRFDQQSVSFDSAAVATTTPLTRTLTFTLDGFGTIDAPAVLTSGTTSLDFTDAGTGSCTTNGASHVYNYGDTCTVDVRFAPSLVGQRQGAVQLTSGGNVLATVYVSGSGTGPQVAFTPGTISDLNTGSTTFSNPYQTAQDGAGNLYVTSYMNSKIFKIPAGGGTGTEVTTLAANQITGIAIDGAGNLFYSDYLNSRVVVVPVTGAAGTLSIPGLTLSQPTALLLDGNGNLYVSDYGNSRVLKVALNNTTLNSGSPSGTGSVVSFPGFTFSYASILDLALDSAGTLYVGDYQNNRVVKVTSSGVASVVSTGSVTLTQPMGVAVDPAGNLYIADSSHRVVQVSAAGDVSTLSLGSLGNLPYTMSIDQATGNLILADFINNKIRILDRSAAANALSFPNTSAGSTSASKIITLTNIGNDALSLDIPSTGNNPSISSEFSLNSTGGTVCPLVGSTSSTSGSLAAGASCTLPVSFAPTTSGTISGSLVLTNNNLNATPSITQSIALTGTGVAPLTATTAVAATTLTLNQAATPFTPVTGSGGTAPLTYSVAPALPVGLTLNASTGEISGTPTALSGAATYTVTVTDSTSATATADFTLEVATLATGLTLASPGTHTYGDAPFALTATSASSGALTYSVVSGPATIAGNTVTIVGEGTVLLRVDQAADGSYPTASASASFTVQPAALTVTANDATRVYGVANPAFTGAVTGAKNNESFTASFTTTATTTSPVGSYTVTPSVTGATLNNYAVFTANGTLTVTKAASATTLALGSTSATPVQTVALTATVASATTGTPTGTVTFLDNGTALGTAAVSGGVASYNATFASGSHVITASYAGDGNFVGSVSATTGSTITVTSQDFTFTGPSTTQVYTGTSVAVSYQLAPVNGAYPGPVTFSVTGLPTGATWTTTTTSLAANAGPQTITLLIKLPAATASAVLHDRRGLPISLALLLLPLAGARRMRQSTRRLGRVLFVVLLLAGAAAGVGSLTGCGSGGSTAQPATNYNVTVTATAGSVQRTSQLTLSVMNSN